MIIINSDYAGDNNDGIIQQRIGTTAEWNKAISKGIYPAKGEIIVEIATEQNPQDSSKTIQVYKSRLGIDKEITRIEDLPLMATEGGSGVGQTTNDKGEIFNYYISSKKNEKNKALSDWSHAEGASTVAGSYGFKITKITGYIKNQQGFYEGYQLVCEIKNENIANIFRQMIDDNKFNIANKKNRCSVRLNNAKYYSFTFQNTINISSDNKSFNIIIADEYPSQIELVLESQDVTDSENFTVENYLTFVDFPELGDTLIGFGAHSEGENSFAQDRASHAEGRETKAIGQYSHAEGRDTVAGYAAHAEGRNNISIGDMSHAEGQNNSATASRAHVEGFANIANGENAHAEGTNTTAGYRSHAEGESTFANATSHAEGRGTKAIGAVSHAEGINAEALAEASHAENHYTKAIGYGSHTEGHKTEAYGKYSHAEGYQTRVGKAIMQDDNGNLIYDGDYSHASGEGTIARGTAQTVIGKYNMEEPINTEKVFVIGNGSSDAIRSNAFTVDLNGNTEIFGDLVVNGDFTLSGESAGDLITADNFKEEIKLSELLNLPKENNKIGDRYVIKDIDTLLEKYQFKNKIHTFTRDKGEHDNNFIYSTGLKNNIYYSTLIWELYANDDNYDMLKDVLKANENDVLGVTFTTTSIANSNETNSINIICTDIPSTINDFDYMKNYSTGIIRYLTQQDNQLLAYIELDSEYAYNAFYAQQNNNETYQYKDLIDQLFYHRNVSQEDWIWSIVKQDNETGYTLKIHLSNNSIVYLNANNNIDIYAYDNYKDWSNDTELTTTASLLYSFSFEELVEQNSSTKEYSLFLSNEVFEGKEELLKRLFETNMADGSNVNAHLLQIDDSKWNPNKNDYNFHFIQKDSEYIYSSDRTKTDISIFKTNKTINADLLPLKKKDQAIWFNNKWNYISSPYSSIGIPDTEPSSLLLNDINTNTANSGHSIIGGSENTDDGGYSFIGGTRNTNYGAQNLIWGIQNEISSTNSYVFGTENADKEEGDSNFIVGTDNIFTGSGNIILGKSLEATGNQFIIGEYNRIIPNETQDPCFIVGMGTSDIDRVNKIKITKENIDFCESDIKNVGNIDFKDNDSIKNLVEKLNSYIHFFPNFFGEVEERSVNANEYISFTEDKWVVAQTNSDGKIYVRDPKTQLTQQLSTSYTGTSSVSDLAFPLKAGIEVGFRSDNGKIRAFTFL